MALTYRHELKYCIGYTDRARLCARLGGLLQRDSHAQPSGIYKVRSLYFDDYSNSSYDEKLMGKGGRHKYRIRVYNDSETEIRLEKKVKEDRYVAKASARLTRENTESILRGEYSFLLHDGQPLCGEFYHSLTTSLQRPRVIVDYEREPFVFHAGDVRVTFDMNIRAGIWDYNLFDSRLPTCNVMEPGLLVLEVKYTEFLPGFLQQALTEFSCAEFTCSKFVLACEETMFAARPM